MLIEDTESERLLDGSAISYLRIKERIYKVKNLNGKVTVERYFRDVNKDFLPVDLDVIGCKTACILRERNII